MSKDILKKIWFISKSDTWTIVKNHIQNKINKEIEKYNERLQDE